LDAENFSYNPEIVPSIRVNARRQPDPNGIAEPVCQTCVDAANPKRKANGLQPIVVLPGAYDCAEVY
jgi:hypothetical protein